MSFSSQLIVWRKTLSSFLQTLIFLSLIFFFCRDFFPFFIIAVQKIERERKMWNAYIHIKRTLIGKCFLWENLENSFRTTTRARTHGLLFKNDFLIKFYYTRWRSKVLLGIFKFYEKTRENF
jgi:hypothetical protein